MPETGKLAVKCTYDSRYNIRYIRFREKQADMGELVVINEATGERTQLPLAEGKPG